MKEKSTVFICEEDEHYLVTMPMESQGFFMGDSYLSIWWVPICENCGFRAGIFKDKSEAKKETERINLLMEERRMKKQNKKMEKMIAEVEGDVYGN